MNSMQLWRIYQTALGTIDVSSAVDSGRMTPAWGVAWLGPMSRDPYLLTQTSTESQQQLVYWDAPACWVAFC